MTIFNIEKLPPEVQKLFDKDPVEFGEALAHRHLKMVADAMAEWKASFISEIPCARCGGEVVDFSIPNEIWNAVIRAEGHERDDEYICMDCFIVALKKALGINS